MSESAATDTVLAYLTSQPLEQALWWFIENAAEEAPWRSRAFFALRERVREHTQRRAAGADLSDAAHLAREWRHEVITGATYLGYREWHARRREAESGGELAASPVVRGTGDELAWLEAGADREFIKVVRGRGYRMILDDPEEQFRYRSELDQYLLNRLDRVKFELSQTGWTDATHGPLRKEFLGRIVTFEDRQMCTGPEGSVVGIRYVLNELEDNASRLGTRIMEIVDEMDRCASDLAAEIERRIVPELANRMADQAFAGHSKDVSDDTPSL